MTTTILPPTRLLGVIGMPIAHSLSPILHTNGFLAHGFPGAFMAWAVRPEELADFVNAVRTLPIHGLAVTIPHKQAIMQHLDGLTKRAEAVGAVNTLFWENDKLTGDNTDIAGFMAPLAEDAVKPQSAIILGGGGAARAAAAGLAELSLSSAAIANRTKSKAESIAADFQLQVVDWDERTAFKAELVVNATPLGMAGEKEALSPYPAEACSGLRVAYDMVYNPLETVFLREAKAAGAQVIDGLRMFVGQAEAQFKRWTEMDLPKEQTRAILLERLVGKG